MQNYPKTSLDSGSSTLGNGQQLEFRNTSTLPATNTEFYYQHEAFVSNFSIHNELSISKVRNEIRSFGENYLDRLIHHDNPLAIALLD